MGAYHLLPDTPPMLLENELKSSVHFLHIANQDRVIKHIANALKEELDGVPNVANFAIVHIGFNRKT